MSSDSDDFEEENEIDDSQKTDDVLKILLTTDNHLGFMEKDPERSNDSFVTFEEALQIARNEQVDFILLGGDLFHENKPSRDCLFKCQKLLREYCFGSKSIEFDVVSDENMNFGHTGFPIANFNDPNLNVSIPVFSIHGNHDDPTGSENLCALNILASAGLINYFGKSNTTEDNVEIFPLLIEKGNTKLAIYGLGAIKDERLHHLFEKGAVNVNRPTEDLDNWFNMFVIHQNRVVHGKKNYIPEYFLPNYLDLVMWGHEHESRIRPEYNEVNKFFVTQPGSTVITSLCESETLPKHVGILKIYKKKFKLEEITLRTMRQFMIDDIVLSETSLSKTDKNLEAKIEQLCVKKVEKMLEKCSETRFGNEKQPIKPLIRLKVDYTDFEMISETRFAQKFVDKVANPRNILQFYRKQAERKVNVTLDESAARLLGANQSVERLYVEDLVSNYFKNADEKSQLSVLTEKGLADAIHEYVEKDEKDAIMELINFQIDKTQKYLRKVKWTNEKQLYDELKKFKQLRIAQQQEESGEIESMFEKGRTNRGPKAKGNSDDELNEDDDDAPVTSKRSNKASLNNDDDEIEDDDDGSTTKSKRGGARGGRARGTRGARGGRGRGAAAAATTTQDNKKRGQLELTNMMSSFVTSTKKPTQTSNVAYSKIDFDDDDIVCLKDEPATPRSTLRSSNRNTTKMINYEDDDDNMKLKYDDDDDDKLGLFSNKSNKKRKKF